MPNKELEQLKKENDYLKRKLEIAKVWMRREIKWQVHKISKLKTNKMTASIKEDFLKENIEEVISKRITDYFWELLLINAPKWTIEAIITSEINFYNMTKNPSIDGFSVISWYHKTLDLFIESFITNNFRKFAKKRNCTILRVNDPLEKALNLVVNKKYILSVWRLYALIKLIKEDYKLEDYGRCFKEYLEKYRYLSDILFNDDFFKKFTYLNKSGILSTKRHSWSITKKETIEARNIFVWDFKDKNAILYKLLESQSVIY